MSIEKEKIFNENEISKRCLKNIPNLEAKITQIKLDIEKVKTRKDILKQNLRSKKWEIILERKKLKEIKEYISIVKIWWLLKIIIWNIKEKTIGKEIIEKALQKLEEEICDFLEKAKKG